VKKQTPQMQIALLKQSTVKSKEDFSSNLNFFGKRKRKMTLFFSPPPL
jgi:hypothetical protein